MNAFSSFSFLSSPLAVPAVEATPDTDSESCVEKAGSLCGLGAAMSSPSPSLSPGPTSTNKAVKQNGSIQSLPDLEFGVLSVSNSSRPDSPRSLGFDSDSSHSFREFDQMCSRTIGGTVGSFRTTPKEDKDKDTALSKEAVEFLSMLPDYRYLVC